MDNTYDIMVSHPDYFKQLAVNDMLFVTYKCPQVEKLAQLHTHFNLIGFTLNGKKIIHLRDRSWLAEENKGMFLRATAYIQEMIYNTEWEVLAFFFRDDILRQVFNEYKTILPNQETPPAHDMIVELHVNDTIRASLFGIVPYFSQQPPAAPKVLELKFKELLLNILMTPANSSFLSYVRSLSEHSKPMLAEIMEANYTYKLSLAELARISQRSLSAFKREFTATYHIAPAKWIMQKRLADAKYLLETSTKNVNELAADCGFDSPTHFNRAFKTKYGLPPLQHRKKMKENMAGGPSHLTAGGSHLTPSSTHLTPSSTHLTPGPSHLTPNPSPRRRGE
jgi:AraC-like DNA-binding protein